MFASCNSSQTPNTALSTDNTKVNEDMRSDEVLIEIERKVSDRTYYDNLQEIEEQAELIVRAIVKENLGQEINTSYDTILDKHVPVSGYTKQEIEVTKVYKGDVNIGDKLVLMEEYYLWPKPDGNKRLVTTSFVKPLKKESEYLMFLKYQPDWDVYYRVGDYQGIYPIPTDEIRAKLNDGVLKIEDLNLYDNYGGESLPYLIPFYKEAVEKYPSE